MREDESGQGLCALQIACLQRSDSVVKAQLEGIRSQFQRLIKISRGLGVIAQLRMFERQLVKRLGKEGAILLRSLAQIARTFGAMGSVDVLP
jgi:hypothetical protein